MKNQAFLSGYRVDQDGPVLTAGLLSSIIPDLAFADRSDERCLSHQARLIRRIRHVSVTL
jgi:hypothetical protein